MFDLGFADELARILALVPPQRQNLLFSATFPAEVHALANALLHDSVRADVPASATTTPRIEQRAILVDRPRRTQLLRQLITTHASPRVLVRRHGHRKLGLPRSSDDYLHRIGRTGRAGETGMVVSFITAESVADFALVETRQALALPREIVDGFERQKTALAPLVSDGTGGIKDRRKSRKDKLREATAFGVAATPAVAGFQWRRGPRKS